jgi:YD repeat-containing protein
VHPEGLADGRVRFPGGLRVARSLHTRYDFDGAGNHRLGGRRRGAHHHLHRDAAGHPTGRTDALGAELIWRRDGLGNLHLMVLLRRIRAVVTVILLLATAAGCVHREPILPMCEGSLYVEQAIELSTEALADRDAGDETASSEKIAAARASLAKAQARLQEASSKAPDYIQATLDAFRAAIDESGAVLDLVGKRPAVSASVIEQRIAAARGSRPVKWCKSASSLS